MAKKKIIRKSNRTLNLFADGGNFAQYIPAIDSAVGSALSQVPNVNKDSSAIEEAVYGNSKQDPIQRFIGDVTGSSTKGVIDELNKRESLSASNNDELMSTWDTLDFQNKMQTEKGLVGKTLLGTALGAPWLDYQNGKVKFSGDNLLASAQGATQGSSFGPWGALAGGILGGVLNLVSRLGRNKRIRKINDAIDKSNAFKVQSFQNLASNISKQNALNAEASFAKYGGNLNIMNRPKRRYDMGGPVGTPIEDMVKQESYKFGYSGVDVSTAHSDFMDTWNKNRYKTGRFESQLGNGQMEQQKANRDNTLLYTINGIYDGPKQIISPYLNTMITTPTGEPADVNGGLQGFFARDSSSDNNMYMYLNESGDARLSQGKPTLENIREVTPLRNAVVVGPAGSTQSDYYKYLTIKQPNYSLYPEGYNPTLKLHETAHASKAKGQEAKIGQIKGAYNKRMGSIKMGDADRYLDSSSEIYSRLMELRRSGQFDPNKVWDDKSLKLLKDFQSGKKQMPKNATDKDYEKFYKKHGFNPKWLKSNNDFNILNRYDDTMVLDLFNNVAMTTPHSDIPNANNSLHTPYASYSANGGFINNIHGGDFSNGVTIIGNGGTHEENPMEGVPMGIAPDGTPNLVEQGEVKFNNYVFSNRLFATGGLLAAHNLPATYADHSFADIAERLSRESSERPNDPISKRGLISAMTRLQQAQEQLRAEEQSRKYAKGGHLFAGGGPAGTNPDLYDEEDDYLIVPTGSKIIGNPFAYDDAGYQAPVITSSEDKSPNTSSRQGKGLAWLRYAPAVGAGLGVLTDALGLTNSPDYGNADLVGSAVDNLTNAEFTPIGNYLTYRPLDRNYYINKLNAQAGATRRAIVNQSGGNRATALAGLLAADYNTQSALGNLARQAEEYNLNQRKEVGAFNRGTNQFNSEMGLKASIANKENDRLRLQARIQQAQLRDQADARSSAGRAANLTNLFDSLGDIGREEFSRNMIQTNPALYYSIDRNGNITYKNGYDDLSEAKKKVVRDAANKDKNRKKSKGGYLTIRGGK